MRTLSQALDRMDNKGGAAQTLRKHLEASNIREWEDVTKSALFDFRDEVMSSCATSTAKTIFARAKALFNRYSDESTLTLPDGWLKILSCKNERPKRAFLTTKELDAFEMVETKNDRERIVQIESLVEAYTGARISDVMKFTEDNFKDGVLSYTSVKTGITSTVPISEKTKEWIIFAQENREKEPCVKVRNDIIRRLAKRAGICERIKVYEAGVEKVGEKWEFLSSHSFRISTATNLSLAGASLLEIKSIMGHSSASMTERYIVSTRPNLSAKAMAYFM